MVPAISRELHPFSVFDYDHSADQQIMTQNDAGSFRQQGKKQRVSTFSSIAHMAILTKKMSTSLSEKRLSDETAGTSDLQVTDLEEGLSEVGPTPSQVEVVQASLADTGAQADRARRTSSPEDQSTRSVVKRQEAPGSSGTQAGDTYAQVFISPAGDWTRQLSSSVQQWSERGSWITPCWVQGPFLSPFSTAVNFGHLMLVASGIGLSAAMPVVTQMRQDGHEREVYFVWMSRSLEQLAYQLPTLVKCTACFVYYTGKSKVNPDLQAAIDAYPNVALYQGRPKLDKVLAWICSQRSVSVKRNLKPKPMARRQSTVGLLRRASVAMGGAASSPPQVAPSKDRVEEMAKKMATAAPGGRQRRTTRERIARNSHESPAQELKDTRSTFHLPDDVGTINGVDEVKIQHACHVELPKESSWCVLYCGAVPTVRATLSSSTRKSAIHYAEESFNW